MKNVLLFVLALTFQTSLAGVTAQIPVGGGSLPNYFSGTSCRISGHVGITGSTLGLRYARMTINGETVWEKTFPNPARGPWQIQQNVDVLFSSTHFAVGSDAEIQLYVEGLDNTNFTTSAGVPIENKAHVYSDTATESPWWSSGSRPFDIVKAAYESLNHDTTNSYDGTSWDKSAYLGACYWTNGGFANCHGLTDQMKAANGDIINESEVSYARIQALGNGLPPFNTVVDGHGGRPLVNIVFHTCCWTGINSDFGSAYLFPGQTAYGTPYYENQCFVGWDAEIAQRAAKDTCTAFYQAMQSHKVISDAIDDTQDAYDIAPGVNEPPGFPATCIGYGDGYARLSGVYTGTKDPAPNVWYSVIES